MALAVAYQTVASVTTTAGTVYTTPSSGNYAYGRDLVVNNSGASTIFVGLGTLSVATSVASFSIPAGGSIVLTECQVPTGAPLTACTGTGSSSISVGFASVVSVI